MTDTKAAGQETPKPGAASETPTGDVKPSASGTTPVVAGSKPPAEPLPASPTSKAGDKAGSSDDAPKVPERYDLVIPKGKESYLDAKDLAELAAIAKENGWSQEEAQDVLETQADAIAQKLDAFRAETEADPTYGGDHLEANQQLVKRLVDRIRPQGHPRADSFRRTLLKTGIGNNLEMFSFFADVAKTMREDSPPTSGTAAPGPKKTREEMLYDHVAGQGPS